MWEVYFNYGRLGVHSNVHVLKNSQNEREDLLNHLLKLHVTILTLVSERTATGVVVMFVEQLSTGHF